MLGFPDITDSFILGQDILYRQFNDIDFYVEDTGQENLYFNILKKIFPGIKFEKIFPLDGKNNVIDSARQNLSNKRKVYIVDLDFDGLLNSKDILNNLFYLERYSIENYLYEKNSIFELIREKNPKLKNSDIRDFFDFEVVKSQWKPALEKLSTLFLIVRKYSLPNSYYKIQCDRDYHIQEDIIYLKGEWIDSYYEEVKNVFVEKNKLVNFSYVFKESSLSFNSLDKILVNSPGKYILTLLKHQLKRKKLINDCDIESFTYKLAKESDFDSLSNIRDEIESFIKS